MKRQAHSEAKNTKPVSPASATREELKAAAEQAGWTIRELTFDEVQRMSSSELRFHETFNREKLDRAFELERNRRLNGERMAEWDAHKKWQDITSVTPEESEQARKAGATFAERHPRFERTQENTLAICQYMADRNLDPTQVGSYVEAFNFSVEAGEMKLTPVLSADQYLAANANTLLDKRVPPLIEARKKKAEATEKHFEKAQAATAEGTTVRLTDYPDEATGYPPAPTKYSFRKLLDSLDAASYRKRINDDPAFSAAVDKMQNGK